MAIPVENPPRILYNGLRNSVPGSIGAGDLTLTFASPLTYIGGNVPTLTLGNGHIPLRLLDPTTRVLRECVRVTAYTSGSLTATVLRNQEGVGGGSQPAGCTVAGAVASYDFGSLIAWAPVLWQATTDPVLGNGSAIGQYTLHGPLCAFSIIIQAGSSTTYGTGSWQVGLPVPVTAMMRSWGTLRYGAGNPYPMVAESTSATSQVVGLRYAPTVAGDPWAGVGPNNPEVASSSNLPLFRISGTYLWG